VEAHALRQRGWTVSAIARHLDKDRKTIRAYLSGQRVPGQRKPAGVDRFEPYAEYCRIRFADDPHLWATTLFEEVRELKYDGAYPSFTRALRKRGLRPRCERCAAAGTPAEFAVIEHPAGEETQWDWVELPDPPSWWGQGRHAHLLTGALSCSGAWRGVLAECEEQPYLVASLHGVCERLGGLTRRWRIRPDVHGVPSGNRGPDRLVRRGREALRRRGGRVPLAPRLAQGRGGEGQPRTRSPNALPTTRRDHRAPAEPAKDLGDIGTTALSQSLQRPERNIDTQFIRVRGRERGRASSSSSGSQVITNTRRNSAIRARAPDSPVHPRLSSSNLLSRTGGSERNRE